MPGSRNGEPIGHHDSTEHGHARSEPATRGPGVPTQVAGLPVISVTDALAVKAAGVDDREIAVHGGSRQPQRDIAAPL